MVAELVLLRTPTERFPRVVEANQWVIFEGSLGESVMMNWGVEVALTCRMAQGVVVPMPRRPPVSSGAMARKEFESMVALPE